MNNEIVAVGRSADGIATEIRVIVQQARTMMATAVIEVGKKADRGAGACASW